MPRDGDPGMNTADGCGAAGGRGAAARVGAAGRAAAERRRRSARSGEDAAAAHLESLGFGLLARNLRIGRHEIDILATDPESREVVIVEVKSRARTGERPEDRVDHAKRRSLSMAAELLSLRRDLRGASFRFDVIAVSEGPGGAEIVHWRRAFAADEG